jgi:hypothetical protein
MKRAVKIDKSYLLSHSSWRPPEAISPNEFVTFYAVVVFLPDIFVFLAPAAHQIGAYEDIAPAFIARDIMTSADIEQPYFVAKLASDICEKVANRKVAYGCHANHSLSRSMIRPFLI